MPTFRLTLEYDGRDFAGWQVQPGGRRTVQGTLEAALQRLTGQAARVIGAGRTDAGVHAEGQIASVPLATRLDAPALHRALNAILPEDVAARAVAAVEGDFDARREARAKLYRYRLWNGESPSPLRRRDHVWVRQALDLDAMREASRGFVGSHDFASLQTAGSRVATTVRTLSSVEVLGYAGGEVRILVEGDGFLRHMVRNLVGTLLQVGAGRRAPDSIPALLAARDRRLAGPTAPPGGLTLVRVSY
jgi:tRNA pseudouridine38-40 synthase